MLGSYATSAPSKLVNIAHKCQLLKHVKQRIVYLPCQDLEAVDPLHHSQEKFPLYEFSQSTHELAHDLWGRSGRKLFPQYWRYCYWCSQEHSNGAACHAQKTAQPTRSFSEVLTNRATNTQQGRVRVYLMTSGRNVHSHYPIVMCVVHFLPHPARHWAGHCK